ncbi:MAG: hypothetical protein OHK0029_26460 [Armatimonadaceae bacterium]
MDVILLDVTAPLKSGQSYLENPAAFLACGELKGGIDPAGADEHWKTAATTLQRIRATFQTKDLSPSLFFAGAAIEKSMAEEIFQQLQSGELSYAANRTRENQMNALADWLIQL